MLRVRRKNHTAGPHRRPKPRHGGTPYRTQWRSPFGADELCGRARLLHEQESQVRTEPEGN